jgi:hypothetical protein
MLHASLALAPDSFDSAPPPSTKGRRFLPKDINSITNTSFTTAKFIEWNVVIKVNLSCVSVLHLRFRIAGDGAGPAAGVRGSIVPRQLVGVI